MQVGRGLRVQLVAGTGSAAAGNLLGCEEPRTPARGRSRSAARPFEARGPEATGTGRGRPRPQQGCFRLSAVARSRAGRYRADPRTSAEHAGPRLRLERRVGRPRLETALRPGLRGLAGDSPPREPRRAARRLNSEPRRSAPRRTRRRWFDGPARPGPRGPRGRPWSGWSAPQRPRRAGPDTVT